MKAPVAAAAILMAMPDAVLAHTIVPGVGGFAGGLIHPLLVPAHGLALAALGLLAGQQEQPVRRAMLAAFALGALAGFGAIASAVAVEDADMAVLVGAAVAGLLVAWARPLPTALAAALAAIAGAAIELDSVPEEITVSATVVALAGTMIAALLALALAAMLAAARARDWQRIGIRVLGSWSAASAILVLALRLAR
jgi:urease accessory protein